MGGAFTYDASGTGSIMAEEASAPVIRLNASDNWVAHTPAGNGPMGEHVPTLDLVAETLGSNECSATG